MIEASPANLELTIVLPLGVVANQLMRIEADLRFLNMKALAYAKERESSEPDGRIAARPVGYPGIALPANRSQIWKTESGGP